MPEIKLARVVTYRLDGGDMSIDGTVTSINPLDGSERTERYTLSAAQPDGNWGDKEALQAFDAKYEDHTVVWEEPKPVVEEEAVEAAEVVTPKATRSK